MYFFDHMCTSRRKRAHLVDLSFGDTVVKNDEKAKNRVFIVLYAGKGGLSGRRDIFDSASFFFFLGDIAQNIKNEKGATLSMPFFSLYT